MTQGWDQLHAFYYNYYYYYFCILQLLLLLQLLQFASITITITITGPSITITITITFSQVGEGGRHQNSKYGQHFIVLNLFYYHMYIYIEQPSGQTEKYNLHN